MIKIFAITLLTFSVMGCFSLDQDENNKPVNLGERDIQYYANKTVTSLEVPPDLTQPNSQDALKLNEYVSNIAENTISFSKNDAVAGSASKALDASIDVQVKKMGQIRWLVVDKKLGVVWDLAQSFFESHGFEIKKTNKKIGIMETDFLENRPEIPDQSIGFLRSMLKKAVSARYALPTIDKYRIRIEPTDDNKKTEVYLTLSSMEEVITDSGSENENTIWQVRSKDETLETEMLYRFMLYLGSDQAQARNQIVATQKKRKSNVELVDGVGGYAKLKFSLDKYNTWESVGWALDQLGVDVEDKDMREGSFYINIAKEKDKGIFSDLFGDDAIKESYQIVVRQISSETTEVYFNDLSEQDNEETVDFSHELLGNIADQF
ncbi:hypothetical protein THERMOT_1971 [Bathymodiolus thermophilus thioautotrophic gill symbiont]|uniref:Outer membrane protein assembly factor BamC n=1 Tax=Bathymodiolus thermophilus thioautotrophic gill symbiont TaxID=2360 RepID=A0A8H9CH63_9GAMM|nr:outer membrane protein assembly factor BamC [Bathymodiolus thermophilus thioautotrophic gill symbiont]CAB5502365.1 hypothetical protein THERMOS_1585 [Bathymodiolus thermophilus thioautotrophic gill symbiont]CAB5504475.1 hypothetical protein THERMOT_1971 [Bathymodiolus thermophilus thioautotrophic gill symbiont]